MAAPRALGAWLSLGFAVAATGGPLAIAAIYPSPASTSRHLTCLFVCMNPVVFLGAEVPAGAMPRILGQAAAIGLGTTLFASVALANGATAAVAASDLPRVTLAWSLGTPPARATALALLTLVGIAGLIVAEFVALARLWGAAFRMPQPEAAGLIAALFIGGDAISLLGPQTFYRLTLLPSLIALYIAQTLVFAAYPASVRRRCPLRLTDAVVTAAACLWAAYGLYGVIARPPLS